MSDKNRFFGRIRIFFKEKATLLKFILSSLFCYAVDYGIYSFLVTFPIIFKGISGVSFANIGARVVSSSLNFFLNRKFVFKNKEKAAAKAVEYFALAALILVGSTSALGFAVGHFTLNKYYAKLVIDIFFFIINWLAQRFIIFK